MNSIPDQIQIIKPSIGSHLIADLAPNPFLEVQAWLIRWQILQTQTFMSLNKKIDFLPSMPSCPIHIKPDGMPLEPAIHLFQRVKEPFPVSLRPSHQALTPEQGSHPAKEVKALMMLASRRDPKPLAGPGPAHAQTRMKRKSGFILKNNGFSRTQRLDFFLRPDQTAWPLRFVLEGKCSQPASSGNPTGASKIGPGEPSKLSQNAASGEPPRSGHPIGLGLIHTRLEVFPDVLPVRGASWKSNGLDGPVFSPVLKTLAPVRSLCASRDSNFDALNPRLRLSTPVADPPVSAKEPLFLSQHGLPGFAESWPLNVLDSLRDALPLRLDSSCRYNIISYALCQII